MIVEKGGMGSSEIIHRPLMRSCKPVIITWLCFNIFTSYLVKMSMQSSSQSCSMEMREPMMVFLKMWADFFLEESLFDIFKVAHKLGLMMFPFAT